MEPKDYYWHQVQSSTSLDTILTRFNPVHRLTFYCAKLTLILTSYIYLCIVKADSL